MRWRSIALRCFAPLLRKGYEVSFLRYDEPYRISLQQKYGVLILQPKHDKTLDQQT